jgi:hypothetical protein
VDDAEGGMRKDINSDKLENCAPFEASWSTWTWTTQLLRHLAAAAVIEPLEHTFIDVQNHFSLCVTALWKV